MWPFAWHAVSVVVRGFCSHLQLAALQISPLLMLQPSCGCYLGQAWTAGWWSWVQTIKNVFFFQYYIKVVLWLPPPQKKKKIQIIAFDIVGEKNETEPTLGNRCEQLQLLTLTGGHFAQWRDIIPSRAGLTVQSVHPDVWWSCHWFCTAVPVPAPKSLHPGLCAPVLVLCMVQLSGPWLC